MNIKQKYLLDGNKKNVLTRIERSFMFITVWAAIFLIISMLSFNTANAELFSLEDKNAEHVDTVFPELVFNTESCLIDCSATFKYCLDNDKYETKLTFNTDKVKTFGYYSTETETYEETGDCIKETTKEICNTTFDSKIGEDVTTCENITTCDEYKITEKEREVQVWHDGLPDAKKGCYTIYITGQKGIKENVDWIPTLEVQESWLSLWSTKYSQTKWAWWNTTEEHYRTLTNLTGNFSYINISKFAIPNVDDTFLDVNFIYADSLRLNHTIETVVSGQYAIMRVYHPNVSSISIYYANTTPMQIYQNASDTYFKPRAYYYFDNNNVNDVIGTLSLTTNDHGTASATGYINDSRTFDGTNDNVSFSGLEEDLNGSNAMSMCLWFNADALTSDRTIISDTRQAGGQTNFAYRLHSATELQIAGDGGICAGGWWVDVDNGFTFSTDTWYHLCLVLNTTGKYTFINGVFRNNTGCSSAGTYEAGNTPILLGDRQYSGTHADGYFDGEIDEVGFWKYSLKPSQILALYNSTAPLYVLGAEKDQNVEPTVNLTYPENDTTSMVYSFTYNFTDAEQSLANCSIIFDGILNNTEEDVDNATESYIDLTAEPTESYHNWSIVCFDGTSNGTSETWYYYYDATPPSTYGVDPDGNTTMDTTPDFKFYAVDNINNSMDCSVQINGAITRGYNSSVFNNTVTTITNATPLSDGYYTWQANCWDAVGGSWSTAKNFTIDTTEPVIDIRYPINNGIYPTPTIYFEAGTNEPADLCWLSLNNGTTNASMEEYGAIHEDWNYTNNSVTEGVYKLTVWCNDTVGNENTTYIWFSAVDKTINIFDLNASNIDAGESSSFSAWINQTQTNLSSFVFTTNNSGTWVNDSWRITPDRALTYDMKAHYGTGDEDMYFNITIEGSGNATGFDGEFNGYLQLGTGDVPLYGIIYETGEFSGLIYFGSGDIVMNGTFEYQEMLMNGTMWYDIGTIPFDGHYKFMVNTTKTINSTYCGVTGYGWYANDSEGITYLGTETLDANCPPVMVTSELLNASNGTLIGLVEQYYLWCNATDADGNNVTMYNNMYICDADFDPDKCISLFIDATENVMQGDKVLVRNDYTLLYTNYYYIGTCLASDGSLNSSWMNSTEIHAYDIDYTTINSSYEKETKTFWINFTGYTPSNVQFYFNGTNYSMSAYGTGFRYTFTFPTVTENTNLSYGYIWTDNTGTYNTTNNITIINIEITSNCTGKAEALVIDYLDEKNISNNITENMNLEIIFTLTYADGSFEYVSFNTTNLSVICTNNNTNVSVIAQMLYYKDDWAQRTHYLGYLLPFYINNVTQYMTLYTLNESLASPITYTIYDWNGEPYKNAYLDIERFYTSANNYQSISVSRTDNDGQATIYLEPLNAFYKAVVAKDNEIKYTDEQGTVIATSARVIRLTQSVPTNYYTDDRHSVSTFSYNNTTRIVATTTVFDGTDGSVNLTVIKSGVMGDVVNCSQVGTGSSITLYCTIPNSTTASYKVFLTTNESSVDRIIFSQTISDRHAAYGSDALVSVLMIVMSLTFFFMRTPEFAIAGNLLGLWICFGMGLFNVGTFSAASMIGLTFAGIIVWVAIRK